MVVASIALIGFIALSRLAVDYYPSLEFPVLTVSTTYTGAAPEEVEKSITRLVESAVSGVNGIDYIESTSSEGRSVVSINFKWGANLDLLAVDVREKLDLIRNSLPENAGTPIIFKFSTSLMPVMGIGLSGSDDMEFIYNLADNQIKPRLEQVEGVATANISGGLKREVQVNVSRNRLMAYGLDIGSITKILMVENQNVAGGSTYEGVYKYILRTTGEFKTLADIQNVILTVKNGVPVKLKDVAEVKYGYSDSTGIVRVNGRNGVTLFVNKEAGMNTVTVAKAVRQKLKEIEPTLPAGIKFKVFFDTSKDIENSINNVRDSAIQGAILAIIILMIYLWNFRTVLIIGISIPTSIISTFILMYFFNVTLNIVSLSGLTLGVGMMVDSSIVVLENIFYHRKLGSGRYQAAVGGTEQVMTAIVASTLTTVVVFVPILFVQGFTAQIFRDLALTVTISLMSSLLVSITLVPMLASKLVSLDENRFLKPVEHWFTRKIDEIDQAYGKLLQKVLKRKKWVIGGTVLLTLLVAGLFTAVIGKEGMPSVEEGQFQVSATFPVGTRIEYTERLTKDMERKIVELSGDNLDSVIVRVNTGGFFAGQNAEYKSTIRVTMVPKEKRTLSQEALVEKIRQAFRSYPARVNVRATGGGSFSQGTAIQIELRGDDLEQSDKISRKIVEVISKIDGVREAQTSKDDALPEVTIRINRDLASKVGLNAASLAQSVQTAFGGTAATTVKSDNGNEMEVIVRLRPEDRLSIDNILSLNLPTPVGKLVPLASVVSTEKDYGPVSIYRKNSVRTVNITAERQGRPLSDIMTDIKSAVKKEVFIPSGFIVDYTGANKDMEDSFKQLILAMLLSVVLVYAIMASQFESLLAPLIIMFAIPFGYAGAVFSLFIAGQTLNTIGLIGIIVLAGIVVNNGIVLLDYMNQLMHEGMDPDKAAKEAGMRRLRPVSMTTLTTILGLVPMALGLGEGAELYQPLAIAVMGGLSIGTLFTLVVVPTTYSAIRKRFPLKKHAD